MKKILLVFSLLLCVTLIVGCGSGRPEGMPDLVDCVITIQNDDGSPVDKAIVSLSPDGAGPLQWSVSGSTGETGTAEIYTDEFSGAPAGKYKVIVRKTETFDTGKKDEFGPITEARLVTNEKYANAGTTPLTLEIAGNAVNETFKLDKK
jgi:hypothetical protein